MTKTEEELQFKRIIGNNLRRIRKQKQLTQSQVGLALGYDTVVSASNWVSKVERAANAEDLSSSPDVSAFQLVVLSVYMDVSIADLLLGYQIPSKALLSFEPIGDGIRQLNMDGLKRAYDYIDDLQRIDIYRKDSARKAAPAAAQEETEGKEEKEN